MAARALASSGSHAPQTRMRAALPCARNAPGFTLLEVLAVLVITALASTVVLLTLPDTQRTLPDQADALATALSHARDEAILSLRMTEVVLSAGAMPSAARHVSAGWRWTRCRLRPCSGRKGCARSCRRVRRR